MHSRLRRNNVRALRLEALEDRCVLSGLLDLGASPLSSLPLLSVAGQTAAPPAATVAVSIPAVGTTVQLALSIPGSNSTPATSSGLGLGVSLSSPLLPGGGLGAGVDVGDQGGLLTVTLGNSSGTVAGASLGGGSVSPGPVAIPAPVGGGSLLGPVTQALPPPPTTPNPPAGLPPVGGVPSLPAPAPVPGPGVLPPPTAPALAPPPLPTAPVAVNAAGLLPVASQALPGTANSNAGLPAAATAVGDEVFIAGGMLPAGGPQGDAATVFVVPVSAPGMALGGAPAAPLANPLAPGQSGSGVTMVPAAVQPGAEEGAGDLVADDLVPAQGPGLVAGVGAFDLDSLERAVQQFVEQVQDLGAGLAGFLIRTGLYRWLGPAVVALAAAEVVRRRWRARAELVLAAALRGAIPAWWFPGLTDPSLAEEP